MTFGLRCSQPACRPHQASLPVRVPAVESLLRASFGFASRLRLAFRYGCRHLLRRAPFISIDSAHAGHTGAANLGGEPACLPAFNLRRRKNRKKKKTSPPESGLAAKIGVPTVPNVQLFLRELLES